MILSQEPSILTEIPQPMLEEFLESSEDDSEYEEQGQSVAQEGSAVEIFSTGSSIIPTKCDKVLNQSRKSKICFVMLVYEN